LDLQLQVIDALITFAGKYEDGVGTHSAEAIASQLYQNAIGTLRQIPKKKWHRILKVPVN